MSEVTLKNIKKVYPNGFQAVKDFNLDVKDGEFVIFVGPSGCGKSTTSYPSMLAHITKVNLLLPHT